MYWPEGWITETDMEFCGDESDSNHAGYVIDRTRVLILDALGIRDYSTEGIDDRDWESHLRTALRDRGLDPRRNNTRETWRRILAEHEIGLDMWDVACGREDGEAYDFAMRTWGWKLFRRKHISSWYLRQEDWGRIRYGLETAFDDLGDTEDLDTVIRVTDHRGHAYSCTVREILDGEFPTGLEPGTLGYQESLHQQVRKYDLAGLQACYGDNLGD